MAGTDDHYRVIFRGGNLHIRQINREDRTARTLCGAGKIATQQTIGMKDDVIEYGLDHHRTRPVCQTCESKFRQGLAERRAAAQEGISND